MKRNTITTGIQKVLFFNPLKFLNQFNHLKHFCNSVYFLSKYTNLSYDFIAVVKSNNQEFERLDFHPCSIF